MKYLLDTTVVSDFVRGHAGVRQRLLDTPPADLAISAITVIEVEYGLARNPERAIRIRPVVEELLRHLTVLGFNSVEALATGELRGELARIGSPIGPWDAAIAGTARVHRLVMVTSNVAEFRRVGGLTIEDWRDLSVHEG